MLTEQTIQVVSFGDEYQYHTAPTLYPGPLDASKYPVQNWTWTDAEVTTLKINEEDADGHTTFGLGAWANNEGATDQTLVEAVGLTNGTGTATTLPVGTKVGLGLKGQWVTTPKLDASGAEETDALGNPIQLTYVFAYLTDGAGISSYSAPVNGGHTYVVIPIDHAVPFNANMALTHVKHSPLNVLNYEMEYTNADCFTPGTLIDTPDGPCLVEDLVAGASVTTRDHGAQPVVWVGRQLISAMGLDQRPNLRPIRIKAGALGPNRPEREMRLSPQHRVLARGDVVRRMFDEPEVLVPAKHLTALEGVDAECPASGITYIQLLFDKHELLSADGIWAESLLTGPQALKNLSPAAYREITGIFPHLRNITERPPSIRPLVNGQRGRRLAERCAKNKKTFQTC